jgi:organic hydroperoxide reductase OsmC/OhrA
VDPEEAFVAALASCHMLWFLSIAAKNGFCVQTYRDRAVGTLARGSGGKLCMTTVTLRPHAVFRGDKVPTSALVREMHAEAHRECFIANSVTTRLTTDPTFEVA